MHPFKWCVPDRCVLKHWDRLSSFRVRLGRTLEAQLGIHYTNFFATVTTMRSRIWTHRSGMPGPRDALYKGRVVKLHHRPRDALSKGRNIRDFSFGDASVRDTLSRHPSLCYRSCRSWVTSRTDPSPRCRSQSTRNDRPTEGSAGTF